MESISVLTWTLNLENTSGFVFPLNICSRTNHLKHSASISGCRFLTFCIHHVHVWRANHLLLYQMFIGPPTQYPKSRAWCKTIVSPYIKWGSYNSFAPSPWNTMFKDSANTIPQLSVPVIDFLHSTVSMLHGPSPCYRCLWTRPIQYPSSVFRL